MLKGSQLQIYTDFHVIISNQRVPPFTLVLQLSDIKKQYHNILNALLTYYYLAKTNGKCYRQWQDNNTYSILKILKMSNDGARFELSTHRTLSSAGTSGQFQIWYQNYSHSITMKMMYFTSLLSRVPNTLFMIIMVDTTP